MKIKKDAFPNTLFVKMEKLFDGEEGFWPSAGTNVEVFEHGDIVGVYELTDTRIKKVVHSLV